MNLRDLERKLEDHMTASTAIHAQTNEKLDIILGNHLAHMEPDIAVLKSNVASLLKVAWFIGFAIGGLIITAVGSLIFVK